MIATIAIVSNTGEDAINNIENQMYLLNCPLPIYEGVVLNNTDITIEGFAVVYNITHNVDINGFTTGNDQDKAGTKFICSIDELSPAPFGVLETPRQYGITLFGFIPYGQLGFVSDWLGTSFGRLQAGFTLISFFVTPANFNILGYGLGDIGGVALMFVIGIYAMCYIFIGLWIYKTVSPFSGAS